MGLSNAQIQGRISVYPNDTSQGLLVNFDKMILSYVTMFKVENGTVILEKTIKVVFLPYFGKTTVKSEIDKNLHSYLPTSLLETIKADLCEEVRKKINLDDLRFQIQREIYYMYRIAISQRLRRTMVNAFKSEEIHSGIFTELHFDTTNYRVSIMNR